MFLGYLCHLVMSVARWSRTCPACATTFLHPPNFLAHLSKPKCSSKIPPDELGVLLTAIQGPKPYAEPAAALPAFSASKQRSAIYGDLRHKEDLYDLYQTYGPEVQDHFSNAEQARYLQEQHADLIPSGNWNEHSLGTIFEDLYNRDVLFRSEYICHITREFGVKRPQ
jgi:hypothetical protein